MSRKTTITCDDCGNAVEGDLVSINISGISSCVRTMPDEHIDLCNDCWRLMRNARRDWKRLEEIRIRGSENVAD
jgi:hypothetical protein